MQPVTLNQIISYDVLQFILIKNPLSWAQKFNSAHF